MTEQDEITKLRAERDALAAALKRTDEAFEKFAQYHGSCCDTHNSTDETAAGECELCDIDRDARRHADYQAILAAHDAEVRKPLEDQLLAATQKLAYFLDHIKHHSDWNSTDDFIADVEQALEDASMGWGTCGKCDESKQRIAALEAALKEMVRAAKCMGSDGSHYDYLQDCRAIAEATLSGSTSSLDAALRQARVETLRQAKTAAIGCKDYGGGYRDDKVKLAAYHHGMETVANVIQALIDNPSDLQARVVTSVGMADEEARRG